MRTLGAGRVFACVGAAAGLLSTTAFVSGGVHRSNLRGQQARQAAKYAPFAAEQPSANAEQSADWRALVGIAAGFGFAMAVLATPVQAQEETAAPPPAPAATEIVEGKLPDDPTAPARASTKKKVRPGKKAAKKAESTSEAVSTPVFSSDTVVKGNAPTAKGSFVPGKNKVILSPADEIDEDELPLGSQNLPLAALIFFGPSVVFTFFWVLGSLDII